MYIPVEERVTTLASEVLTVPPAKPISVLTVKPAPAQVEPLSEQPEITEELLIEEVSIDGMCGVY